ncbi:MAG: 1-deoxy-D-xylulose-5-phosphate synthase [Oscillospiraceae bacterium]|nr:1-deoxy-D-xylulose-5-phosphate synthase [Oscillospiraceae bacterium]
MPTILPTITSPAALRALPPQDLPKLAEEIREVLIETVSRTGGHLASNLGVVELTLALHLCFDSPRDALVWDVSHQSYTHKLLTGRYGDFSSLRQSGGLSGFTSPTESEHDLFIAGHASTGVSSALGLAEAKRLMDDQSFSVAILGDGALTGGMVYEALNNAGRQRGAGREGVKLVVVLNDNGMSISRNVGGFSRYLARVVRARPAYRQAKRRVERALRHIPYFGNSLAVFVGGVKDLVKRVLAGTTVFEELGLDYIGPVDGHDLPLLRAALESAKLSPRPALVHVRTVKGRGLPAAEAAPELYHGIARFDIESGEPIVPSGSTYTDVFAEELCALADENPEICAVTAAMAMGTGLDLFAAAHPRRFFDVGIAEAHAVTFAAGMAKQGLRSVAAIYATFLQRAFDQLLHDAALQGLPLTVAVDRAGFVGADGATHHGLYDVAFCAAIPNCTVWSPATADDLRIALRHALACKTLQLVRFPRDVLREPPPGLPLLHSSETFDIYGETDAQRAIVTYGRLFFEACQVPNAKILKLKRVQPLDAQAIEAALPCARIDFYEEGIRTGGAGERFGLALLERRWPGQFTLTAVDGFARHATVEALLAEFGLDAKSMDTPPAATPSGVAASPL